MSDTDDISICAGCGRMNYDRRCIWCGSDQIYTGDQYYEWRADRIERGIEQAHAGQVVPFAELADPIMADPARAENVARHRREALDEIYDWATDEDDDA